MPKKRPTAAQRASQDVKDAKVRKELRELKATSRAKDKALIKAERLIEAAVAISETDQSYVIKPNGGTDNEAVAVVLFSDAHIEEIVEAGTVNDLNEFNEAICFERIERFWRHVVKLLKKEQKGASIKKMVLGLLGDNINGSIHDELMESNRISPTFAIIEAEGHIEAGIDYILANTDLDEILVVCHTGNHGRTGKMRIATEQGNSLERLLYHHLKARYVNEPRVKWLIAEGYHSYVDVLGTMIRFHHGHQLRYQGGVGGLYIPVGKACDRWNRGRWADLDCFGHFHQLIDAGKFVCNGSVVGYNPYAMSIKAEFEPPKQAFFLIDRDDGKTVFAPIVLHHDK